MGKEERSAVMAEKEALAKAERERLKQLAEIEANSGLQRRGSNAGLERRGSNVGLERRGSNAGLERRGSNAGLNSDTVRRGSAMGVVPPDASATERRKSA